MASSRSPSVPTRIEVEFLNFRHVWASRKSVGQQRGAKPPQGSLFPAVMVHRRH